MLFDKIKNLADKKGLNLKELAIKLGYSENIVYAWKKSSPKVEVLQTFADYLDVSVDYLLGRVDEPNLYTIGKEPFTIDEALDTAMSYDGKPISESDREIMKGILKGYLNSKQ